MMTRDTVHNAVRALASGRGITRSHRPPSVSHSQGGPTNPDLSARQTMGSAQKRENRSTRKWSQVAPDSCFSPVWTKEETETVPQDFASLREQPPVGDPCASATVKDSTSFGESAIVNSTTLSLPAIQRGLRASRILPVELAVALGAGGGLPSGHDQPLGALSASAPTTYRTPGSINKTLVYPEGELSQSSKGPTTISGSGLADCDGGGGGGGGTSLPSLPSRSPPAVTNLDLSPSASLSDTSTLPRLELDLSRHAPPMSPLSKTSCPHTAGNVPTRGDDGPPGGETNNHGRKETRIDESEDTKGAGDNNVIALEGGGTRMSETTTAVAAPAPAFENATADTAVVDAADGPENDAALGRRQAERLRDRLNKTLLPQGVEITCVMVCSVELSSEIAKQMVDSTMNVSLAAEQREKKQSDAQRVRCEEEILGLDQMHKIERELAVRAGDEEVEKVRRTRGYI